VGNFKKSCADGKEGNVNIVKALMLWRRHSAYLLHERPPHRTPLKPPPSIKTQIETLAAILNGFLGQFANTDIDPITLHTQGTHLEAVIGEGAKFGYRVFSEPCAWRFVFDDSGPPQQQSLVVKPGLLLLSNHEGELYKNPPVVMEAEMEIVDNAET